MTPTEGRQPGESNVQRLLGELAANRHEAAWSEFLRDYAPVIHQVVRLYEFEADPIADCFLFVCEQLSRKSYARLRKFRSGGPATFTTWLRAVVRNLCLDWHRSEVGRYRVFQSVARLPSLDRDVFKLVYEEARPAEEVSHILKTRDPGLTDTDVATSLERIRRSLSPRQLWLLSVRSPRMLTPDPLPDGQPGVLEQIRDTSPDPESLAALNQRRTTLSRALRLLPAPDRLLVRLRFEEDLTLEQVARLAGLKDAQTADRRIRLILAEVRTQMERRGKGPDESV